MKKNIHPTSNMVNTTCLSCGKAYVIKSTYSTIKVEICSNCHPFYTGQQKIVDSANKVSDFNKRLAQKSDNVISRKDKNKNRAKHTVTEIKGERTLTLKDMLQQFKK